MKKDLTKSRLSSMMEMEKQEMTEATRAAALLEFTRIAGEFFDTDDVSLNLKRGKSGLDVVVSFRASRVKNFTTLK